MSTPGELITNHVFDELQPGLRASLRRVIRMEDIQAFALVSGDVNPAHVDTAYADASRFRGVIAHGMFAGALISSLLGTEFPGPGTIYIGQSLHFHRPVRLGDALDVEVVVMDCDAETHNVRLDCTVKNQHGELVVSGEALVRAPTSKLALPRVSLPELHLFDPQARLLHWLASLQLRHALRCAVVHPCDEESLKGALDAGKHGLIVPVLVGPAGRIRATAAQAGLSLEGLELHDCAHSHAAAEVATAMAAAGDVAMLMKGSLHTDELISAVLAEPRLRTGRRLSHVFRFEVPSYAKPLLVTDAAINIRPNLEDKADIARNAIELAHALGVAQPRVALLAAVETVTPRLSSTLDAAALCKMADRGQIRGALLDGPLAFDNAISSEAAEIKGIQSKVAGQADILLVPDLESGNMLAKQLEYLAGASSCGVVLGAKVPIALTSRADKALSRVASAALAWLMAEKGSQPAAGSEAGR